MDDDTTFQDLIGKQLKRGAETCTTLAGRLQVSEKTVRRWRDGDFVPTDIRTIVELADVMSVSKTRLIKAITNQLADAK